MHKTLALRFDIDTIKCLRDGVPALLALADRARCRFTFFINMGRAIAPRSVFGRRAASEERADKLSPYRKLGPKYFLETLFINPCVGAGHATTLQNVVAAGHELGLHGGRNHGAWQRGAMNWDSARLAEEVEWGVGAFEGAVARRPTAFSSPGFTHPAELAAVMSQTGFRYTADDHDPGREAVQAAQTPPRHPLSANTNLLGTPGNVGFIEWCMARGLTPEECAGEFTSRASAFTTAILYDHPCLAGDRGIEHLGKVIDAAARDGWRIATIEAMLGDGAAP